MGLFVEFLSFVFLFGVVSTQTYKVCIHSNPALCQSLDKDGSKAVCEPVGSRTDCAIKLARGTADMGIFSEEEMMLLGIHLPNEGRVVATIRDVIRPEPYAFEAVAVVPSSFVGGLDNLRGGHYCHPGFDQLEQRWSPRVLKTFEQLVVRTDRISNVAGKTVEEQEVEMLSQFFDSACRPGLWSVNATIDVNLKRQHPSLCALCGDSCNGYSIDMGVSIAGVRNNNPHVQALQCLRQNERGVAYVAWQHVREFFTIRHPQEAMSYALLCTDGTLRNLTPEVINNNTSPCAFVRQPWGAIVSTTSRASELVEELRVWWPAGSNPGGNSWQSILFNALVGGANARVLVHENPQTPANYTSAIRTLTSVDSSPSSVGAKRWCTLNTEEQNKCSWIRAAAHTLGIQPSISCQLRPNIFECLRDIRDQNADFIVSRSNYGYIARQHFKLSPVKLVQNSRSSPLAFSKVTALLKDSAAQSEITRFENLRDKKACFPEFGGIAYMSFVRTAQERGVLSRNQCDYAAAVGELFSAACAPGALDASHSLGYASSYNATSLCTACKPAVRITDNSSEFTCAWDYTNMYFGNNGSLSCLADPSTHVAFVETQNLEAHLQSLGLQASQFRALCRNNTLAATAGINMDDNCLLAYVVDSEVLTRRDDSLRTTLSVLLDTLDQYFGYNAAVGSQLINLEMYSPFDGINNLLFKDSAVGLSEPSLETAHEPAKNYIELFQHLETCTGGAPTQSNRALYLVVTLLAILIIVMIILFARIVLK